MVGWSHCDMGWMDIMLLTTVRVPECKLGPFEYIQSISKWPKGLVYIGNTINCLPYLPDTFPKGLEVDLEGSSTFKTLMILIPINRLGLFSHLYRCLFNYITTYQGSWAGATVICMEVG